MKIILVLFLIFFSEGENWSFLKTYKGEELISEVQEKKGFHQNVQLGLTFSETLKN